MMTPEEFSKARGGPWKNIHIRALGDALGAEVEAGELRRITDAQFLEIRRAWLEHHVLRFRGLDFSDDDLVAFSRRFGDYQPSTPNPHPAARSDLPGSPSAPRIRQAPRDPRYPQVSVVSNIIDGGVALIFNSTEGWQSLKDSKPIRQAARTRMAFRPVEFRGTAERDPAVRDRGAAGTGTHWLSQRAPCLRNAAGGPAPRHRGT